MPNAATPASLRELRFFEGLSEELIERVAAIARLAEFPAGGTIFREGAPNRELFLISSGHVSLEMTVPRRGRAPILSIGPGEMLAWSAALGDGRTMTATAIALEPTRAIAIPGDALRALCESDHELGHRFFSRMAEALSQRLVATRLQMLDLFAETALH